MAHIPYSTQSISEADIEAVSDVLRSAWLTQGPTVPAFESAFAALHGVDHAVAVCNATAGLHIACLALGAGPGSMVWTSPNSFVASANCAIYCGASVDFVDIDPETRNMSVDALAEKLQIAERSGRLPNIVIPVHFAGLSCDMAAMRKLADRYGFLLLEDASHAVGARYDGEMVGSRFADMSVFSFHPVKIITTGEGGMVTTRSAELAHRLRLLRSHGITRDKDELEDVRRGQSTWYYEQQSLGFNYRLTDLQAALGLSQLSRIDELAAARARLAARYEEKLAPLPLKRPSRVVGSECAWHLYVVELTDATANVNRDSVFDALRAADIGVNVHYIPIHLQPFYRSMGFQPGQFPAAERYYANTLSIPLYPRLSEEEQDYVVDTLAEALTRP